MYNSTESSILLSIYTLLLYLLPLHSFRNHLQPLEECDVTARWAALCGSRSTMYTTLVADGAGPVATKLPAVRAMGSSENGSRSHEGQIPTSKK